MRRKEFETETTEEIEQFLQEMSFGFLGTVTDEGYPAITPLNYVFCNEAIYFHGSRVGEKMTNLKAESRVTFCVAKEYAIIPSYFSDPIMACPATAYFKSVIIKGSASVVEDLSEKAIVLQALMVKLQPEGGHKPIEGDDPEYRGNLRGVAVVKITPQQISGKFKFGQNLNSDKRVPVMEGLVQRGDTLDAETLELMRRYCPYQDQ